MVGARVAAGAWIPVSAHENDEGGPGEEARGEQAIQRFLADEGVDELV